MKGADAMITITLPEWFVWFLALAAVGSFIRTGLAGYELYLQRKLRSLK